MEDADPKSPKFHAQRVACLQKALERGKREVAEYFGVNVVAATQEAGEGDSNAESRTRVDDAKTIVSRVNMNLVAMLLLPSLAEAQNALQKGLKFLNSVSDSLNQASGSPQGQQPQAQSPSPFAAPAAADADDDAVPAAGASSLSLGGKPAKDEANDDEDDEPKASSGSFSFGKPKAEAAETVEVTAKGQGESVEAAKKDAVRNAIKQAVGELVGAKTLVENDELVEDKILTLSNAMVENAFYGDAKSIGDGLFEVPVKAVVKKGKLNQELEKIGVMKGAVKGDSLAAKLFSGRERVANARASALPTDKGYAIRLVAFP